MSLMAFIMFLQALYGPLGPHKVLKSFYEALNTFPVGRSRRGEGSDKLFVGRFAFDS